MNRILYTLICLFLSSAAFSQYAYDRSVLVDVKINKATPSITLRWNQYPAATSYVIYRKAKSATSWGTLKASVPATDSSWTDTNVQAGKAYEYRVVRAGGSYTAYGYVYAGIDLRIEPYEGIAIVLVDSTMANDLQTEIDQYLDDMVGEGWIPIYEKISPLMDVKDVKKIIKDIYDKDPANTKSLFLIGHIPVPYSGDINPDGHPDHLGAWPTDAYYGDLNGVWTDNQVSDENASDPRNRNVPDDGKFDQSYIPTPMELQVGRVDFNDLPAFSDNATELTRKYLIKNHAFRTKEFVAQRRGVLQDNFNFSEGFSQSAYKSFSVMFGKENVFVKEYRNTLLTDSYLWSYGCGGGNYVSAGGITSSFQYATDSLQTVFTMLFGSYFGDWDSQNNFLRSSLASGQTLTNVWAGRPNWHFHHMALGETIGYSTRLAMNNTGTLYDPGYGANFIHVSLIGDPTLKLFPARPVSTLNLTDTNGNVEINWTSVTDSIDHYELYSRTSADKPFSLIANVPSYQTNYIDSCVTQNQYIEYMVRASSLETTASGTYFNLSKGAHKSIIPSSAIVPQLNVNYSIQNENVTFTVTGNANSYLWNFGDGSSSTEVSPAHSYSKSGTFTILLYTDYNCSTKIDTFIVSVILTGLNNTPGNELSVRLYPTVANTDINLELSKFVQADWKIFNYNGQLVKAGVVNDKKVLINVSDIANGFYYIQVDSSTGSVIKNFSLQH